MSPAGRSRKVRPPEVSLLVLDIPPFRPPARFLEGWRFESLTLSCSSLVAIPTISLAHWFGSRARFSMDTACRIPEHRNQNPALRLRHHQSGLCCGLGHGPTRRVARFCHQAPEHKPAIRRPLREPPHKIWAPVRSERHINLQAVSGLAHLLLQVAPNPINHLKFVLAFFQFEPRCFGLRVCNHVPVMRGDSG